MLYLLYKKKMHETRLVQRAGRAVKIQYEVNNEYLIFSDSKERGCSHLDDTVRQALDKMEGFRYSTIPLLSKDGRYAGTITEGDLLWGIRKEYQMDFKEAENAPVASIARRADYKPVTAESRMEDMIDCALNQNFVPVVDDRGLFIGIITRKDIIKFCYEKLKKEHEKGN